MAIQVQLRRGTTAQNNAFTGALGETTVDTDKKTLVVHDGSTAGGFPLAKASGSDLSPSSVTLSSGTANGVLYLNGSKQVASGSGLAFNGSDLIIPAGIVAPTTSWYQLGTSWGAATLQFRGGGTTAATFDTVNGFTTNVGGFSTTKGSAGYIGTNDNYDFYFNINSTEQMRLTSTGLGIGTSSPTSKLDIRVASSTNGVALSYEGTVNSEWYANGTSVLFGTSSNHPVIFRTNNTERMRLDSSGNLGLGVTPSAWWAAMKAIDISSRSAVLAGGAAQPIIAYNWYVDASQNYIYKTSNYASQYEQFSGQHRWYTAPSGTAGGTISFTQAMTLDASGNLLVGKFSATSNGGDVQVSKGITFPATQVACSDANTLDDYEEGTFNAGIAFGGAATGVTYVSTAGAYVKIGRMVWCSLAIQTNSKGTSAGALTITGLPFVSSQVNSYFGITSMAVFNMARSTGSGGTNSVSFYAVLGNNTTSIPVYLKTAAANVYTAIANTDVLDDFNYYLTVCYQTSG